MATGSGTYTYDKSFNIVPAAQLLNIKNQGQGWIDLTDYIGNTLRFHIQRNCPNGGTQAGSVIPNTFTDYKADPGNGGLTPPNIVMIDTNYSGQSMQQSQILAKVINDSIVGFAGFNTQGYGPSMIALGYRANNGPYSAIYTNFTGPAYSLSDSDWSTIGSNTYFGYTGNGQPTGNGFNNTSIDAGISTRIKVLVMQNNPRKVNNTQTTANLGVRYYDGNTPISYGEPSSQALFMTGEEPGALVGGKCEMIKAHYPLNSITGQYNINNPLNTVHLDQNVPVGLLGSGVQSPQSEKNQVPTQTTSNSGCLWSTDHP